MIAEESGSEHDGDEEEEEEEGGGSTFFLTALDDDEPKQARPKRQPSAASGRSAASATAPQTPMTMSIAPERMARPQRIQKGDVAIPRNPHQPTSAQRRTKGQARRTRVASARQRATNEVLRLLGKAPNASTRADREHRLRSDRLHLLDRTEPVDAALALEYSDEATAEAVLLSTQLSKYRGYEELLLYSSDDDSDEEGADTDALRQSGKRGGWGGRGPKCAVLHLGVLGVSPLDNQLISSLPLFPPPHA